MSPDMLPQLAIKYERYRDGDTYYVVVMRDGWRCTVAGTVTAECAPRYERWRIMARTAQEARKTCDYHFGFQAWRLAPWFKKRGETQARRVRRTVAEMDERRRQATIARMGLA